jgi:hypothetical protein
MSATDTLWCRNVWQMLNDGGVWGVPRSGLMYRKDEAAMQLVLYARMPHDPEMPMTAAQLREQQDSDHEANREQFAVIGVTVTDES